MNLGGAPGRAPAPVAGQGAGSPLGALATAGTGGGLWSSGMVPVTVVWAYRRTGKFAFHVLTGSLETDPRTARVPIEFGNGVEAVVAAVQQALARGARVLVGWSFYSPDFATLTKELRAVKARIDDPRVLHAAGGVHAT